MWSISVLVIYFMHVEAPMLLTKILTNPQQQANNLLILLNYY